MHVLSDENIRALLLAPVEHAARSLDGASPASLREWTLHGTTIGAMLIEHGRSAVIFTDGRMSMANLIVSEEYRKIQSIDPFTRMLISGSPGLCIANARALRAWIGYLEDSRQQHIPVRAKVNFLETTLMGQLGLLARGIVCAPILAAYDHEKGRTRIFTIGLDGSTNETQNYVMGGSGFHSLNHLKKVWHPGLTAIEGVAMAREIVSLSKDGDSGSGGRIQIELIGPDGIRPQENR